MFARPLGRGFVRRKKIRNVICCCRLAVLLFLSLTVIFVLRSSRFGMSGSRSPRLLVVSTWPVTTKTNDFGEANESLFLQVCSLLHAQKQKVRMILFVDEPVVQRDLLRWRRRQSVIPSTLTFELAPEVTTVSSRCNYANMLYGRGYTHLMYSTLPLPVFLPLINPLSEFSTLHPDSLLLANANSAQTLENPKYTLLDIDMIVDFDELTACAEHSWKVFLLQTEVLAEVADSLVPYEALGLTCLAAQIRLLGKPVWQASFSNVATLPHISRPGKVTPLSRSDSSCGVSLQKYCPQVAQQSDVYFPNHQIAVRRIRVAMVLEMAPYPNQGGNVRIFELLSVFARNGFHLELFVRKNLKKDGFFHVDRMRLKMWADDLPLNKFSQRVHAFDVVVSSMWFWNILGAKVGESLTIPIVVDSLIGDVTSISHVVVTDDIHYIRCSQIYIRSFSFCQMVRSQEETVWTSSRNLKVFITPEDHMHTLKVTEDPHGLRTVVPYVISPRAPFSQVRLQPTKSAKFKLAYFGKSHEANVLAISELVSFLSRPGYEVMQACDFTIVGDVKWKQVFKRHKLRKSIHVHGEVFDLDKWLENVNLVLLPVTVGGTGVSSKIFKCIELRIPFVASLAGMRGFDCDDDCRDLLFADSLHDFPSRIRALLFDQNAYRRAVATLERMSQTLTKKRLRQNNLLVEALSWKKDLFITRYAPQASPATLQQVGQVGFECRKCHEENCLKICELSVHAGHRNLLSVYCSLLGGEKEGRFLNSFISDIHRQVFDEPWEFVVASSDAAILQSFQELVLQLFPGRRNPPSFRTVHVMEDKGLYETWDYIITSFTDGEFLSNWNSDDRKHELALMTKVQVLQRKHDVDVVSSAVFATSTENLLWEDCFNSAIDDSLKKCEVWFTYEGLYSLSEFVETDRTTSALTGRSQNYPHNAPVYRRRVHDLAGMFSSNTAYVKELGLVSAPTCFDWKFWTTVAEKGAQFYHINQPLEVYLIRTDSHQRRVASKSEACITRVMQDLRERGLYNNAYFWQYDFSMRFAWHKRILFVVDSITNVRAGVLDFMEWMFENGHTVHVFCTSERSTVLRRFPLRLSPENNSTSSPTLLDFDLVFIASDPDIADPRADFMRIQGAKPPQVGIGKAACKTTRCVRVIALETRRFSFSWTFTFVGSTRQLWSKSLALLRIIHA